MICVTIGAVAKSNRCKRKAMTKEKESMIQWYLLILVIVFLI
jgi:predicted nucleic acid-binding Zn ribbon protein